jgi:hypothetical protein
MKSWSILGLAILVFGSLVPLGMAASDIRQSGRGAPEGTCASHTLVPFTPSENAAATGSVIARFVNEGEAATGRICLFDGRGTKRVDTTVDFAAHEARDVGIRAPPGIYTYHTEFASDGARLSGGGVMNTKWCLSHTEDLHMRFHIGPGGAGSSVESGGCVPGTLAVGIAGLFGAAGTFLFGKLPQLGAVVLYTRIAKPRILDQTVRGRVYDLVAREPGIHAGQLMRALDAAEGQTAYHLGVLAREKVIVSMGLPGMKHWFVTGRYTPTDMKAIATLRDPTRRRLYEAVVANPGATLGDVCAAVRISVAQGSRAAQRLERVGLIERRALGRTLALHAVSGEMGA